MERADAVKSFRKENLGNGAHADFIWRSTRPGTQELLLRVFVEDRQHSNVPMGFSLPGDEVKTYWKGRYMGAGHPKTDAINTAIRNANKAGKGYALRCEESGKGVNPIYLKQVMLGKASAEVLTASIPKNPTPPKKGKKLGEDTLLWDAALQYVEYGCNPKDPREQLRYRRWVDHLSEFAKQDVTGNREPRLADLDEYMAKRLLSWMESEKGWSGQTLKRYANFLRGVTRFAWAKGYVPYNRLVLWKVATPKTEHKYLTRQEVARMDALEGLTPRERCVRDAFVFCCLTGLAHYDLRNLRAEDVKTDETGQRWIRKPRQKTGVLYEIPLIPMAEAVLARAVPGTDGRLLRVHQNQVGNRTLKVLARKCAISEKKLTWHVGRKTCATLLLELGVSIETAARVLGHADTRQTQDVYARVTACKMVSEIGAAISRWDFTPTPIGA